MEVFLSCIAFTLLLMIAYAVILLKADEEATEGLTYWLMFIVAVAFIPMILNSLLTFMRGNDIVMSAIFGKGELLILSLPIGLDAVGQVIISKNKNNLIKIIASAGCLVLTVVSFAIFSVMSENKAIDYDSTRIAIISTIMFVAIIICSGVCVYMSEVE